MISQLLFPYLALIPTRHFHYNSQAWVDGCLYRHIYECAYRRAHTPIGHEMLDFHDADADRDSDIYRRLFAGPSYGRLLYIFLHATSFFADC